VLGNDEWKPPRLGGFISSSLAPWTMKHTPLFSIDQGSGKRRVVSLPDNRKVSKLPHTGDARARIGPQHNHKSRATTGPRPAPRKTLTDGYEHKVNSRNNGIPTCTPRSDLGGGGGRRAFLRPRDGLKTDGGGGGAGGGTNCACACWIRRQAPNLTAPLIAASGLSA
jgi:hypothetical protein